MNNKELSKAGVKEVAPAQPHQEKVSNNRKHSHLVKAKNEKDDEYYTRYEDIVCELEHYAPFLKDKVIYCNCDNKESAFRKVLMDKFHSWGIKKLYCSGISGYCMEFDGIKIKEKTIDGDFRSKDCRAILDRSDVVITNPPYSLCRQWFDLVYSKDLIFIANKAVISYQNFFPLIQCGHLKMGYTRPDRFYRPDGSLRNLQGLSRWFTTFPVEKKSTWMAKTKFKNQYHKFDLYPAINVDDVNEIPADYDGLMGVPITFFDKIDDSFKIVDLIHRYAVLDKSVGVKGHQLTEIDGKPKYSRIIIQRV